MNYLDRFNEYKSYESTFSNVVEYFEDKWGFKVSKVLGESIGIAYLTNDNRVLKITPSETEMVLSEILKKKPNKYFPKVFEMEMYNDEWVVLLKEYVPELEGSMWQDYLDLEGTIEEWYEDDYGVTGELMSVMLLDLKDSIFINYLEDIEPRFIKIYQDLMGIVNFATPLVPKGILDIHFDNLGYNGKNLVLYDY
jgi:hypothetical protein